MKPSEFWSQIFALPEQARQADGEAVELRIRADALTAWAKQATSAHRDALFAADVEETARAVEILNGLPARPDAARIVSLAEDAAPLHERTRKQRSDAGKSRGRKAAVAIYDSDPGPPEVNESASANPADVKAEDAKRVKLAGQIRLIAEAEGEPITLMVMSATTGKSEREVREALKLLSLVSWRMRRDGDSQPVEVWGTYKQLGEHLAVLRSCPDGRAGCEVMHAGWHPDDNMLGAIVDVAPSDVFLATKAAG